MDKDKSLTNTNKSIISLSDKITKGLSNLRQEKKDLKTFEDTIFLLDVSGSMAYRIDEKRKIDHLFEVMKNYPSVRKISFNHSVHSGLVRYPGGGTNLSGALQFVKQSNPKKIVLISDGEPDCPDYVLQIVKTEINFPINIIFIGIPGSIGERFMKKLAELSGGKQVTVNTEKPKEFKKSLTNETKLLLTDGTTS